MRLRGVVGARSLGIRDQSAGAGSAGAGGRDSELRVGRGRTPETEELGPRERCGVGNEGTGGARDWELEVSGSRLAGEWGGGGE